MRTGAACKASLNWKETNIGRLKIVIRFSTILQDITSTGSRLQESTPEIQEAWQILIRLKTTETAITLYCFQYRYRIRLLHQSSEFRTCLGQLTLMLSWRFLFAVKWVTVCAAISPTPQIIPELTICVFKGWTCKQVWYHFHSRNISRNLLFGTTSRRVQSRFNGVSWWEKIDWLCAWIKAQSEVTDAVIATVVEEFLESFLFFPYPSGMNFISFWKMEVWNSPHPFGQNVSLVPTSFNKEKMMVTYAMRMRLKYDYLL